MVCPMVHPMVVAMGCKVGRSSGIGNGRQSPFPALPPHPVPAPVTLPAGEPPLAELEKRACRRVKQTGAAIAAHRHQDLMPGRPLT